MLFQAFISCDLKKVARSRGALAATRRQGSIQRKLIVRHLFVVLAVVASTIPAAAQVRVNVSYDVNFASHYDYRDLGVAHGPAIAGFVDVTRSSGTPDNGFTGALGLLAVDNRGPWYAESLFFGAGPAIFYREDKKEFHVFVPLGVLIPYAAVVRLSGGLAVYPRRHVGLQGGVGIDIGTGGPGRSYHISGGIALRF